MSYHTKIAALVSSLALATAFGCGDPAESGQENNATENNATENNDPGNNDLGNNDPGNNDPGNNDPGNNDPGNNDPGNNDPGNNDPGNNDPGNNDPGNNDPGNNEPGNNSSGQTWSLFAHPCGGNRTDALHCDDDQTCFVGCGTTTEGRGLYGTTDGGQTWSRPTTNPAAFFDTARVNDISRSADGRLYVAGELNGPARVVSMDASGALEEVWNRGNTVGFSFTVGSFRRNSQGRAIAESLTGTDLVYRGADGEEWQSGNGFWRDGDADDVTTGVQILDMEVFEDGFYGVGSLISQPPTVFLPRWTDDGLDFAIVQLAASGLGAFKGELWGIDVNADGIVVGGVNQERDTGVVYTHTFGSGEPTDPASWRLFDVASVFPDNSTWIQGVCRGEGSVVYAVGRESREGWGIVLRSTDGGQTFEDISPEGIKEASRCVVTDDGVLIAGAEGLFGRYTH